MKRLNFSSLFISGRQQRREFDPTVALMVASALLLALMAVFLPEYF